MWEWAHRHRWCCFIQKQPNQTTSLLTTQQADQNDAVCSFSAVARMFAAWLNRRRRRYLLLILCCPLLLPLLFATCPIICAVEAWLFVRRRRRRGGGNGRIDGGEEEEGLMQRYLEDQLLLVVGSVYECGDEDEDGADVKYFDSSGAILQ